MPFDFIVYKNTSGEVLRYGTVELESDIALQARAGETSIENTGGYNADYYWDGSTFQPRPDLDSICSIGGASPWLANGTSTISYGSLIPAGAVLELYSADNGIPPQSAIINDGTFSLTTNHAGTYTTTISSFPYLNKVLTLVAT